MFDDALRRGLMRLGPEVAHRAALDGLALTAAMPGGRSWLRSRYAPPERPIQVGSLRFPNAIGLAAGYDKDAVAVAGLDAMGFGHLELGTVTPDPQEGNPGTRIVRLPEHEALVNRMGFPSQGVDRFVARLARARRRGLRAVIGANLGKNRTTPNDRAVYDYLRLLDAVAPHVDYVAINVSSPNTKDLRALQAPDALGPLLERLLARRDENGGPPIWVKLAPDADAGRLAEQVDTIRAVGCDAVVISNTTVQRPVPTDALGGLSGRPLGPLALAALDAVVGRGLPVVAVGGVSDRADVQARLDRGAQLVQIYTGLVYRGPGILRQLVR